MTDTAKDIALPDNRAEWLPVRRVSHTDFASTDSLAVLDIGSTDTRAARDSRFPRDWKDIARKGTQVDCTLECSEDLMDTRTDRDQKDSESLAGQTLLAEKGKDRKRYQSFASARTSPQYD